RDAWSTYGDHAAERLDNAPVELRPGAAFQFSEGVQRGNGVAIGPRTSHGVVGVRHADDPGADRYFVPRYSARIPKAVGALVHVANERRRLPEVRQMLDEGEANGGMLADEPALEIVERRRLSQERFRHGELPQVVQQGASLDC